MGDCKRNLPIANHEPSTYSLIGGEMRIVMRDFSRKSPIANHQLLEGLESPGNSGVAEGLARATREFHVGLG